MNSIFFSIITPTYNRLDSGYLEQCILSVQNQKPGDYKYEHIIVDDGSTDNTRKWIRELQNSDSHLRYYRQKNAGPAKAAQRGISEARGTHVIIVDDDDMLTPDSLVQRATFIRENRTVNWFFGLAEAIDQYGLPTQATFQSKFYPDHFYERMLIANHIHSGTPTMERVLLEEIDWPDWLRRSQDYFLWLDLLRPERGLKCAFMDANLLLYRIHETSYTAKIITDDDKKAKRELNDRIKALHPQDLVFLAREALSWREEAHLNNAYKLEDIRSLNAKIGQLYTLIEGYELSRPVRLAVKARNVARAQKLNVIRYADKFRRTIVRPSIATVRGARRVPIMKWDEDLPMVSVVSPFFNRTDTMPETIRSVLGQTYQNTELIIVNDGSTDKDASDYLSRIKHNKITVLNQINQGVAAARNNGIANARGKYIVCLDSDDIIEQTFIEKAVLYMENNPGASFVTYDMKMFGHLEDVFTYPELNPLNMLKDNYVITAAMFRRDAWEAVGGYKSGIGYEDWEFWVNLVEHGFFGKHIPETLFRYRTAQSSRYIDDLRNHRFHASHIKALHPDFENKVISRLKHTTDDYIRAEDSALVNIRQQDIHQQASKPNVLIVIPWMPVGGAETLTLMFCRALRKNYQLHFITGIASKNEWEHRFRELSPYIYHLPNLYAQNIDRHRDFVDFYVRSRDIALIHMVHSGYVFPYLKDIVKNNPGLKVLLTLFNDRVPEYVQGITNNSKVITAFSTDNKLTYDSITPRLDRKTFAQIIPNAVDAEHVFNPDIVDSAVAVNELELSEDDFVVTFVGRLSEEKNPDVFVDVARRVLKKVKSKNIVFVMIGDGPMAGIIQTSVDKLGDDRFRLLGYRSNIADYLKISDVYVLPSKIEGFPLAMLEAMAMEAIPLASRVGAIPDVIEQGMDGIIIDPGSVEQIATTILDLYHDRGRTGQIQKKAREKVRTRYNLDTLEAEYLKLYDKLINDHPKNIKG